MGSSIWLVVLVPFMVVYAIFGGIKGAIFGYPTAELTLPYDEASGSVWEYDDIDDPYIELVETKFENDKQIFVFVGSEGDDNGGIFDRDKNEYQGRMMELVFTDENGNQKVYYGYHSGKLNAPYLYPVEECKTVDYTLTAKKPKSNAKWEAVYNYNFLLVQKTAEADTCTFTAVITPHNERTVFTVDYAYTGAFGSYLEEAKVWYTLVDSEYSVTDIHHETRTEKWFGDLTNGLL